MKILILGSGLMGPAAAYNALSDPEVSRVVICDCNQQQIDASFAKLSSVRGLEKLDAVCLDLNDEVAAAKLMADFDAAVGALPHVASILGIRAAARSGTPLVDLALPEQHVLAEAKEKVWAAGGFVILGGGLEPGLTEIMARYLAEKLDRVEELHIRCGGIPEKPTPPLGYKIVFGGRQLPLRESDAQVVQDGKLVSVPRYSGVEPISFAGVGECEAWHEGFMPWLLELPALKGLRVGTQKTVRWPGYAAKVTVLKEMGLLSQEPIEVDGASIAPKRFLDTLLYPRVRLAEGERDITVFRVEAMGEKDGRPRRYVVEMVDRYDETLGFTSMARTTAFTGAIIARMMARGDLKGRGIYTPEQLIVGPPFERLVAELAALGIKFDITEEKVETLGA